MNVLNLAFGGDVDRAAHKEFGPADVRIARDGSAARRSAAARTRVWMSHGDRMDAPAAPVSRRSRSSDNSPFAAFRHRERPVYGVAVPSRGDPHASTGAEILRNFVLRVCGAQADWTMENFVEQRVPRIRERVGSKRRALRALAAASTRRSPRRSSTARIGDRLTCIFVDNGLLRAGRGRRT